MTSHARPDSDAALPRARRPDVRRHVGRARVPRSRLGRTLVAALAVGGALAVTADAIALTAEPPVPAPAPASVPASASSDAGREARAAHAAAAYATALEQLRGERYAEALESLRRLQADFPAFERMPAVQTRIAVLQEASDARPALARFLGALERRDAGDSDAAIRQLDVLARDDSAGSLTDDALYLVAYFQVMDRYEFAAARATLLELGRRFPATSYRDSAIYLDAIALEQLGDTDAARTALAALRERHTALALPFDFRWPKGDVLSRYWFDRAERRLGIIERRLRGASTLKGTSARGADEAGRLRLDVTVDGVDMTLALVPSPLVRETAWLDAGLADRSPPSVGVYDGTVVGEADSWVRAVVRRDSITGLVEIDGVRHRLLPANLVGTLDYYLPKPGGGLGARDGTTLAELLDGADALAAPPALGRAKPGTGRATGPRSDVRAVPLSIVVDSRYDRYHAGDGLAAALNDLNVADGIYRGFGLSFTLDEVLTFDAERDPLVLGPVPLETLLRRFRGYRLAQRTLFTGSALTYLFSGNPKTDVTLGLAWIDTLCRTDGYDVGVTTPSAFGDVLVTHELGHSLGAQHDSDTECRGEPDYLMWPNISERTPTTLSPCSEASVRRAHARSCLLDTVDLSLQLERSGDTVRFLASNPDSALAVEATLAIDVDTARRDGWPADCLGRTPTSADCALGRIGPGETHELVLAVGVGETVGGELAPLGVAELDPENNAVALGGGASVANPGAADGRDDGGDGGGDGGDGGDITVPDVTVVAGGAADAGGPSGGPTPAGSGGGGGGASGAALTLLLWAALSRRRLSAAGRRPVGDARRA